MTYKVKEWRKKRMLTQQELADVLKIDRVAVCKWETGVNRPRADKLPDIAKALNCKIDDLFKEE